MITLFRDEYERLIEDARRRGEKKFLVAWNRGLGDIPLCVYGFVALIKKNINDAKVTIMTRSGLDEVFRLIRLVDDVITIPHWTREDNLKKGQPVRLDVEEELEKLGLKGKFDVIIHNLKAGKWRKRQIGKIVPRLEWREEDRDFNIEILRLAPQNDKRKCHSEHIRFAQCKLREESNLGGRTTDKYVVSLHIDSETGHIYGYNKNWDIEKWRGLVKRLLSTYNDIYFILLGLTRHDEPFLDSSFITDMRGRTDIKQLLSIVTSSKMLIAPDSGILNLVHYLDVDIPLDVISLWGPAKYGILQLKVASPNRLLNHFPLLGKREDINTIVVEDVLKVVKDRYEKRIKC